MYMKDILDNDIYLFTKTFIMQSNFEIQILIIQFMMQLYNDIYSIYTYTHIYIFIYLCQRDIFYCQNKHFL